MKRDGKYKFNLQFPSETEEQIRAGELLEKLGHQKSAVVVEAVNDYILQHPELLGNSFKIEIHSSPAFDKGMLELLIRDMVTEHLSHMKIVGTDNTEPVDESNIAADISQMLDNLDLFL